ncbi:MAG: hypothetical protein AAFU53_18065 [Cyanobacteria bacterium J06632_3]
MKARGLAYLQGSTNAPNLYTRIRNRIAELTDTLKNINILTFEMHCNSSF